MRESPPDETPSQVLTRAAILASGYPKLPQLLHIIEYTIVDYSIL